MPTPRTRKNNFAIASSDSDDTLEGQYTQNHGKHYQKWYHEEDDDDENDDDTNTDDSVSDSSRGEESSSEDSVEQEERTINTEVITKLTKSASTKSKNWWSKLLSKVAAKKPTPVDTKFHRNYYFRPVRID
ncbi:unnamed protein product [Phytophthora lilii]|uniref:Unnamed protein product n=1 Tax=Phytophthora lilii TaxID=2077276 RepID=A0A9W6WQV7_9STRA|nr:unnamed protein product [Phytophthora lilii]